MDKNFYFFVLVFFIYALTGCSQSSFSVFSTATPTSSVTPTSTFTPTITYTPTFTPTFTLTPTITPLPYPLATCEGNQKFVLKWETELNEMKFEALVCPDNTLIAIFHNQEFGEYVTVNQGTANKVEYEWAVFIDTDSDTLTGTSKKWYHGIIGADYSLSISKFVNGQTESVLFNEAFQKNVFDCTSGTSCQDLFFKDLSFNSDYHVEYYGDFASKFIVIKGKIPDINLNSKILFYRYKFRLNDRLTYKTDWVNSSTVP